MKTEKEIIYGFEVSEQRKKVWQTELDMVKLFAQICEVHHLTFYAAGGTLLGAVRHKGFIPWDDDIDLMMPRGDYETFLQLGQAALPEGYFLQYNLTEQKYPNGHAQIRDTRTACLSHHAFQDLRDGKNCGVFIDIFPYDEVPDDSWQRARQERKIKFLKWICNCKIYKDSTGVKSLVKRIVSGFYFAFHSLEKEIERINLFSKKYNGKTSTVALLSFMPGNYRNVWKKEWFAEAVDCPFEDTKLPIPKHYHEVLETEFGDYMKIPEDVTQGNMHGKCLFDCEKSYREYQALSEEELATRIEESGL